MDDNGVSANIFDETELSDWIENSDKAANIREAFDLIEQLPHSLSDTAKRIAQKVIQTEAEYQWYEENVIVADDLGGNCVDAVPIPFANFTVEDCLVEYGD